MKLITFLRQKSILLTGSSLFYVDNALANLPAIERPSSGGGVGTYNTFKGYLRDGLILGGAGHCCYRLYRCGKCGH